jgi:dihydroorotase
LGLVRSGAVPLARLVSALTTSPAGVVGIEAPRLRENARADVVLVDPAATFTIEAARLRSKSKNTPFLGRSVQGRVLMTVCEGRSVYEHSEA